MEFFSRYWLFVTGIHLSPADSTQKGQWRGASMFSLIYAWTNGWVSDRDAGDLRRHRASCDIIVMKLYFWKNFGLLPTKFRWSFRYKMMHMIVAGTRTCSDHTELATKQVFNRIRNIRHLLVRWDHVTGWNVGWNRFGVSSSNSVYIREWVKWF